MWQFIDKSKIFAIPLKFTDCMDTITSAVFFVCTAQMLTPK